MVKNLYPYITLLRPLNWLKNLLIFFPLLFSKQIISIQPTLQAVVVCMLFSVLASGLYIINDVIDIQEDKQHPEKQRRPLASGEINIASAIILATIFLCVSLFSLFSINITFGFLGITYFLGNVFYSFFLKRFAIVDVLFLSGNYLIRLLVGGAIIGALPSKWLLMTSLLLALFLLFGKRKQELLLLGEQAMLHRKNLQSYSIILLNQFLSITASALIVVYFLYIFDDEVAHNIGNNYLPLTIPFALYSVLRYLLITTNKSTKCDPLENIMSDRPLALSFFMWLILVCVILFAPLAV